MRLREQIEKEEDRRLARWGTRSGDSLGRLHAESAHAYRSAFQRDRDRLLHSTAFRRLQYKTQVFVYHEGDHLRNRLTHTLEVAQIGRTLARALGCNEDLIEAVILAHDLGHPPFGHAGERAVHQLLEEHGGFEHNRQGLRIVDWIERPVASRPGLNLTQETRAGILKHGAEYPLYTHPVALPEMSSAPGIEAQLANRADEIAYHTHDLDDGLRSGLLSEESLGELRLWRRACAAVGESAADGATAPQIRCLIDLLATDLIRTSQQRLEASGVDSAQAVREFAEPLVVFSPEIEAERLELANFLLEHLYRHHHVVRMGIRAERILRDLWGAYSQELRLLPPQALKRAPEEPVERSLADYLAGMTDRFAIEEHRKLFGPAGPG